jgi:hypothetical protein
MIIGAATTTGADDGSGGGGDGGDGEEYIANFIIERKKISDFMGSMRDSRYSEQPFRLQKLVQADNFKQTPPENNNSSTVNINNNNNNNNSSSTSTASLPRDYTTCKVIYLLEGNLTSEQCSLSSGNITLALAEKALLAHQIQYNFIIKNTINLEDTVAYCGTNIIKYLILK